MSDFIKNAFPCFMLESGKQMQIKVGLKPLKDIINYHPATHFDVIPNIAPTAVRLVVGYFNINDSELKNNLKNQTYISYFNDYHYHKQNANSSPGFEFDPATKNPLKVNLFLFMKIGIQKKIPLEL